MIACTYDEGPIFDEDFDFSIFDDDLTISIDSNISDTTVDDDDVELHTLGTKKRKSPTNVKAASNDFGSKLRRKAFRSRGKIDNNAALNSVLYRKDLRRKSSATGGFKLYAFPSFDRSDALLFLPTAFAGYFNSADSPAISKLLGSHVTKTCQVNVNVLADEDINTKSFLQFHELMSEINPDIIMCVTSTKVVENQIRSIIVMKFTACNTIYESVGRRLTGTVFQPMFGTNRDATIKRCLSREDVPEEDKLRFYEIAETELDLVLHTKAEMVLTVDDLTKKVTHLTITGRLTAMERVVKCEDECEQ